MFGSFRLSMTWVHTWFGLVLGYVLMVCFFFGSLSVFDREIDRWAIPETRFEPQPMPSFDRMLLPILAQVKPDAKDYVAHAAALVDLSKGPLPPRESLKAEEFWAYTTHRDPVLRLGAGFELPNPENPDAENRVYGSATVDPRNGRVIPDDRLKIGSDFFYPMHYSLHLHWKDLGYWIVGLAALALLAALVGGVVMHRKLFREFFTFRPQKQIRRSTLDLHNLTGVVALPFHFFFAFTGLVIFASIYLPVSETLLRPLQKTHEAIEARRTGLPHKPAGEAAAMASVDAMVAQAKQRWADRGMAGEVGYLTIRHVGDRNAYVSVFRAGSDRVALVGEGIHFEATTGRLVREDPPRSAASEINEFLTGLHLQHFEHWLLRWLYVVGGLAGCVCIATGFIFFVEKRRSQHARNGAQGARLVEALAVATVTGMVVAAVAILVLNRMLPDDLPERGEWEETGFWVVWLMALLHAALRTSSARLTRVAPAWREQCWAIALLALTAVGLNWATTGDTLWRTVAQGYWPVAGVDLSLLVAAVLAASAARRLATHERVGRPVSLDGRPTDASQAALGASARRVVAKVDRLA